VPVQLLIPGIGPIPVPAVIKAVAFNLTVVNASMSTYLTVFPAGGSRPNASNIDVYTKSALSNAVIAQVPSTGARVGFVQVQNEIGSIDFIVDLAGYYL
jgi:hypothetical protein